MRPATDLYAVGVVMFEMLAGTAPFKGDNPNAIALAHINAPVPDVRSLRDDVPATLSAAIRTAMAKDPADRFTSAAAMQAALTGTRALSAAGPHRSAVASEPTQRLSPGGIRHRASDPTRVLPPDAYRERRPPPWWLAGVAALALAAALLVWYDASSDPHDSPTAASPPTPSAPTTNTTTTNAPTTTVPTTLADAIAALQANRDAYGPHTDEIVEELVKIQQDDEPGERAADLLDRVAYWVDLGQATPAVLALLEPLLAPLIEPSDDDTDDGTNDGGNGNRGGNSDGGGNGNGRGKND